ncbi:uncharacterized protein Dvir_GJ27141 [Drosophila virilis]|uniref:Uncharacterized protein n=1 Tax=Drosophila virilis TaxID=7244 RepID=A0A0Q9WVG2_DROVI|nr:uncharacterized protein Dvir_GJ27141 [Drosophila virilis]
MSTQQGTGSVFSLILKAKFILLQQSSNGTREPGTFGSNKFALSRSSCESLQVTLIKLNVRITSSSSGDGGDDGDGAWQSAGWLADR